MKIYKPKWSPHYYMVFRKGGRIIRRSLRTSDYETAQTVAFRLLAELHHFQPIKKIPIEQAIETYLEFSFRTKALTSYERDRSILKNFFRFCQKEGLQMLNEITLPILEKYKSIRLSQIQKRTINREIDTLRVFLKTLKLWGALRKNPAEELRKFVIPYEAPRALTPEEVLALLKNADEQLQIFLKAFILTGMRKQELFRLTWEQVDLENDIIYLSGRQTKTRRYRTIPIHPELKKIFLEIKKQEIDSPYVFVNPRTLRPVTDIRKRLKSACQRAGIKPCTLHQLRHTFATMLVAQGTPLPVVQQLLGHTDIRSTQIYLSIFEEQKRKAIESLQLFSGEEKN